MYRMYVSYIVIIDYWWILIVDIDLEGVCLNDAQCTGANVICNENSICACEPGYIQSSTSPVTCVPGN